MGGGRAVPQGKHRKTVLEGPAGVLQKREGSLSEACAVSLPLCLWLTPPHTSHRPSALSHPWGSCVHRGPWGWRRSIPMISPIQTTQTSPGHPTGPEGLQGLREMTEWEPSGQAGGAMEDVLPEILRDRLMGKEVSHPEPS